MKLLPFAALKNRMGRNKLKGDSNGLSPDGITNEATTMGRSNPSSRSRSDSAKVVTRGQARSMSSLQALKGASSRRHSMSNGRTKSPVLDDDMVAHEYPESISDLQGNLSPYTIALDLLFNNSVHLGESEQPSGSLSRNRRVRFD